MRAAARRAVPALLASPIGRLALAPVRRGRATIFMLHRFRHDARGVIGHDPAAVRDVLAYLRRAGYPLLSLNDLFRSLIGDGPPLNGGVAFTIDDGYADHAEVAAPVFAEFDCPVTTFVTSGFLDGTLWMWWDRIEHAFDHTQRSSATLNFDGTTLTYAWSDASGRVSAQADFIDRCKQVGDAAKHEGIARLAAALEVDLPAVPPARYAPMTWDQLRSAERRGMTFGPHTITHPILSRATDAQAPAEIEGSWKRLQAEASDPVAVFCYPNGQPGDFGQRELAALRSLGLLGAVVGWPGYADAHASRVDDTQRWTVRRFAEADRVDTAAQCASGLAWVRSAVRGVTP